MVSLMISALLTKRPAVCKFTASQGPCPQIKGLLAERALAKDLHSLGKLQTPIDSEPKAEKIWKNSVGLLNSSWPL
jgi:hypothetical protein